MLTNVKLGKTLRGVSIVGIGATPFFNGVENPAYKGITNGELFGHAALAAMKDAGVEPRDVQYFFHGSANPHVLNNCITPNLQVADWFGMRGKGSLSHSEGCCTGYIGLEEAVMAVASGMYDIVLSGCSEQGTGMPDGNTPAFMRVPLTTEVLFPDLDSIFDRAYGRYLGGGPGMNHDDWINYYATENGLTEEQVDDVLMKYPYNPKMTQYLRTASDSCVADGAAAVIVVPTEMAHRFNAKPVEVLGIGASVLDAIVPHLEKKATAEAARQVYEVTGLTADDMDLLFVNDFIGSSAFLAAEEIGYLPKGEGWKYVLEGRIAYDGDKPMNTNGGRTSYGHAFGASGMADIFEAVTQMRGDAGERQVKKLPKRTFLRGFGGAQNVRAIILESKF